MREINGKLEVILNLVNTIRKNINKYTENKYIFNITITYFRSNIIWYKNNIYLVLDTVMGIIPKDDRNNYFKIPKTKEEFNEILKEYGLIKVE